jgi:branched-chain amino acid transport system substrate-binding protein
LRVIAIFNLSGSMASVDRPGYEGMRLAAEQANRSGVGPRIELIPVDGESNPAKAAAKVRAVILKGGVDAVAGLYDSDYALAAGRVAQEERVPFVTSGATLPGLTTRIGDHAFMACYGDDDQAAAMAQFARTRLRGKTVAVLRDGRYDYTRTIAQDFPASFEKLGGQSLGTQPLSSAWRGKATDAVYVASLPNDAGPTVRRLRQSGFGGPILSGDGFDTPDLARVAGAAAQRVFFTTHVAYDSPSPAVRQFVAAYRARFGHRPESAAAALAYDTLRLIADANRRRGQGLLLDALASTRNLPGVTGTLSFGSGSREPQKPITVVELVQGRPVFRDLVSP